MDLFGEIYSGLEFGEKVSIPGRTSGVKRDFWIDGGLAVASAQECRC
jgi:hypothetical protein